MSTESPREPRFFSLTESRHFSKIIWGAAVVLLILAVIVPNVDYSLQEDSPRADATTRPFGDSIDAMEAKLNDGRLANADPNAALAMATILKARALTAAGPMAHDEIVWAVDHLDDYQPQIADQQDRARRETVRNHRNRLLFEELPRLSPDEGSEVLNEVRRAYIEAFDVDPAWYRSVPD